MSDGAVLKLDGVVRTYRQAGESLEVLRGVNLNLMGGELIARVATDVALGASLDDRLTWLREQLVGLRNKADMLVAAREPAPQLAAL